MPADLFPPSDFDDWAPEYDDSVQSTDFPFTGYDRVLRTILDQADPRPGAQVLDLGTGTGNLAALFAGRGCRIWGLDFSAAMLRIAARKLPAAALALADARDPLPPAFQRRYDHIVSGYTFHHFPLEQKAAIARRLLDEHAHPGAALLIGDIAFLNPGAQDALRAALGDAWEEEFYWLADETAAAFAAADMAAKFTPLSDCAGVFAIRRL